MTHLLVVTTNGPVEGFLDTHPVAERSTASSSLPPGSCTPIRKWLGIPYAQAERFERPKAPISWSHTRQCWEFGPSFPQTLSLFDEMYAGKQGWLSRNHLGQSEDAFTVNVFAPDNVEASSAKLPVMVWVYGGNLNSGSSSMPLYDPTEFVRDYPCIVVTGNYRVGAFGWLATEDLKQVNGHVGNFGLHDVIAIFEWVQANISAFGGDAGNVTAYGESAGGFLIGTLLVSGRRLFTKAILQSGTYGLMVAKRNPTYAPYDELLALCSISRDSSPTERVQALKDVPTTKLFDATAALFHPGIWTLTHDPEEQGWANPVWNLIGQGEYDPWIQSVIIGINQDEGTFFNNYAQYWLPESCLKLMKFRHGFDENTCLRLLDLYPSHEPPSPTTDLRPLASSMFYSDYGYLTPMLHAAKSLTTVPNIHTGKVITAFLYLCRTLPSRLWEGFEKFGVLHTGEIPFIMRNKNLLDYQTDKLTSDLLCTLWSSFAEESSRPGTFWPGFTTNGGEILIIDEGGQMSVGNVWELRSEQRKVWSDEIERRMQMI